MFPTSNECERGDCANCDDPQCIHMCHAAKPVPKKTARKKRT